MRSARSTQEAAKNATLPVVVGFRKQILWEFNKSKWWVVDGLEALQKLKTMLGST